jgi:hypothetical protein
LVLWWSAAILERARQRADLSAEEALEIAVAETRAHRS